MAFLANNFLFFILISAFYVAIAQETLPRISLGSSLSPSAGSRNLSWLSSNGLYAFGFYPQGKDYIVGVFIAGAPDRKVVWIANRDDPIFSSNSTLALTTDGRLILQRVRGQDIPIATTADTISTASMQDSGNFVLYNSAGNIIWQSFENPNIALLPGQHLLAEKQQELISSAAETDHSKGSFRLVMQLDGYLVQYPTNTPFSAEYAYWQPPNTPGLGSNASLNLENDGHLYLSNSTMTVNLTNGELPRQRLYLAKVDVDGIFRMYSYSTGQGNWSVEWNSSADKCAPKGLCGFNSYCSQQDSVADCLCLPGFDFADKTNKRLGCARNFTTERCKQENGNANHIIKQLENTDWDLEDNAYYTMEEATREDCQKACEEDCNCEVAILKGSKCTKQWLPLRFGRFSTNESNVVGFIKTGTATPFNPVVISNDKQLVEKEIRLDILIISVLLLCLAAVIMAISAVLSYRYQIWDYKSISQERKLEFIDNVAPRAFSYAELQVASNDFNEELGRGAFGTVYKGVLPEIHKEVAIKKLEKVLAEGEIEFQNEIKVIGRTHHRNLVRLLGYCLEGRKRLLVYEYMSNGSLANLLYKPENKPSWEERLGIAMDVARGILYLHEECETPIIHCDIKPQNILMDEQWRAKISDFGMAKLLNPDQTRTYTGLRGTKGYVAPEWHRRQPVTVKADVYSFGIVLLEIVCCRKSLNLSLSENEVIIEDWAYACFEAGELQKLVGDEEVDKRKLERIIKISMWCIQDDPTLRPSMKKVHLMLEGTVDIPKPPSPTSVLSIM